MVADTAVLGALVPAITASTLETRLATLALALLVPVAVDVPWADHRIDSMEITAVTAAATLALLKTTGGATNGGQQDERWTNQVCLISRKYHAWPAIAICGVFQS